MIIILLGIIFVLAIRKIAEKYILVNQLYQAIKKKIFYSSILRIGIQYYFKFCMLSFVCLKTGLSFTDKGNLANSLTAIGLLLVVVGFPLFTYNFLKKN